MRRNYTAIVERNVAVTEKITSEPYECGWASEIIIFVRLLDGDLGGETASVQISPDGMNWCDEGSIINLPGEGETTFVKVREFGNWLRIHGEIAPGKYAKILVTLQLKE